MLPKSPLLENALSSIRMGVEDFSSDQDQRGISAARNIHAGLLLLYKEKLRRLSPADSRESLLMARTVVERGTDGKVVWRGSGKKTASQRQVEQRLSGLRVQSTGRGFRRSPLSAIRSSTTIQPSRLARFARSWPSHLCSFVIFFGGTSVSTRAKRWVLAHGPRCSR